MFINCPHCRRLLQLDANRNPPAACPHCHASIEMEAAAARARMNAPGPSGIATAPSAAAATLRSLATLLQGEQEPALRYPTRLPAAASSADAPTRPTAVDTPASTATTTAAAAPGLPQPATAPTVADHRQSEPADAPAPPTVKQTPSNEAGTARPRTLPTSAAPPGQAGQPLPSGGPDPGSAPSFARTAAQDSPRQRRLQMAAILALALLLGLQLLLAQRAQLAQQAAWRPWLTQLCGLLHCSLPAWHEPGAFVVVERDIRSLDAQPGVLQVTARIRNQAHWAQPWPRLQLTLSDVDGNPLATRIFQPAEYLGGAPTQAELASGADAAIRMLVLEPGPEAVAFNFDFH